MKKLSAIIKYNSIKISNLFTNKNSIKIQLQFFNMLVITHAINTSSLRRLLKCKLHCKNLGITRVKNLQSILSVAGCVIQHSGKIRRH